MGNETGFGGTRVTNLVALHVSGFVKKDWLMITLLDFFESPIKSLTSMLRFVNLGYLFEINLQRTAFLFSKMDWSKRLKEVDGCIVFRRCWLFILLVLGV